MKDERFLNVQKAIQNGEIKKFSDIIKFVPETVLSNLIGKNKDKFVTKKLENPALLKINDVLIYSSAFKVKPEEFFKICAKGIKVEKTTSPRKRNYIGNEFLKNAKKAHELAQKGLTKSKIAQELGVSVVTIWRYLTELKKLENPS
jgi:hypothetical protein